MCDRKLSCGKTRTFPMDKEEDSWWEVLFTILWQEFNFHKFIYFKRNSIRLIISHYMKLKGLQFTSSFSNHTHFTIFVGRSTGYKSTGRSIP